MKNRRLFFSLLLLSSLGISTSLVIAGSPGSHQARQNRPIELGTSGGSVDDATRRFCCSGTLGGLVEDGNGVQYILSNNHVLARANQASVGEDINQPGLIDNNCGVNSNDIVADLSDWIPMDFSGAPNLVDAAIAQVRPGQVDPSGSIFNIGPLASTTLAPMLGQSVKKSGRTTGCTSGTISAIDISVNVGYSTRCGGPSNNVAFFTGQFEVTPGSFSAGGDSGSIIVENVQNTPQAIGLLFAGSSASTIGTPIDTVLNAFNVSMVGGTVDPPTFGSISGTVSDSSNSSPIGGATVSTDTGESTTTAGDGTYSISNVPTGNRTVTASASGFSSSNQSVTVSENQNSVQNFSLSPVVGGSQAIVDCVTYTTSGGQGGTRNLNIAVTIVDDLGDPVENASVSVSVSSLGTATGTTDSAGVVSFRGRNAADTCYSTDVTDVVAAGLSFDGSEPQNGFLKGTDATPDADCRSGSDDCGGTAFGGTRPVPVPLPVLRYQMIANVVDIKRRNEADLFQLSENVAGVGVSADPKTGEPVIRVYLSHDSIAVKAALPKTIEGIPVRTKVSGPFVAY